MKKYGLILVTILLFGTILYYYKPLLVTIGADSGWDSSYDSGGSSSSSSWSSSDYSSGSSGGGSSKDISEMNIYDFTILESMLSIFFFFYGIAYFVKKKKDEKKTYWIVGIIVIIRTIVAVILDTNVSYNWVIPNIVLAFIIPFIFLVKESIKTAISDRKREKNRKIQEAKDQERWNSILNSMGIENKKVTEELYQIFIDVQNAWMNFDYDKLKELCSDELYNSYKKDLEILKLKNGQNIMNSFHPKDMYIKKATRKDNALEVEFYLDIKFKDYVINTKTNKVIRGSKHETMHNKYWLIYHKQNFYTDKCPSCGEKLPATSNTTCPSCGSTIINNTNKFVLVHKERTW